MGCDIHFYVEFKKDGKWTYYDHEAKYVTSVDEDGYRNKSEDWYDSPMDVGRSYNLFSILADVRNGQGFAGVDTGDGFVPISPPRGVPNDISPEVMKEYVCVLGSDEYYTQDTFERWIASGCSKRIDENTVTGPDWHSESWLTVYELEKYDWNQVTKLRGWVDPDNFLAFRKNGSPKEWCGAISGAKVEHVSNQQMTKLLNTGEIQFVDSEGSRDRKYTTSLQRTMKGWNLPAGSVGDSMASETYPRHYTLVEWTRTYRDCCKHFVEKTIPALKELGDPSSVRIVFWFDN